jgi:hypothetical protein
MADGSDIARIRARVRDGERITKYEQRTLKRVEGYHKRAAAATLEKVRRIAELKFLQRLTWEEVAEVTKLTKRHLQHLVSAHPEAYWGAVDGLLDRAEEETRRTIRSAKLKAFGGVTEVLEGANRRLRKIIEDPDSQESVAMTAIKHVHGTLGVGEKAVGVAGGDFAPNAEWKRRAVDTLGIVLAGVERARELGAGRGEVIAESIEVMGKGEDDAEGSIKGPGAILRRGGGRGCEEEGVDCGGGEGAGEGPESKELT